MECFTKGTGRLAHSPTNLSSPISKIRSIATQLVKYRTKRTPA